MRAQKIARQHLRMMERRHQTHQRMDQVMTRVRVSTCSYFSCGSADLKRKSQSWVSFYENNFKPYQKLMRSEWSRNLDYVPLNNDEQDVDKCTLDGEEKPSFKLSEPNITIRNCFKFCVTLIYFRNIEAYS
ncbi:hypothetical protein RIR_jg10232.t1 [Rhizophagus irregularis DAOM 181602=DAOM 197198]|nr:hypothetical protein RIR_jg10232.t1 [Rhizophagus irregularis DAOM 181602=DAOM 197198]